MAAQALWRGRAGRAETARWAAVAGAVTGILLCSVGLIASQRTGNLTNALGSSLLTRHHPFGDVFYVFRRNLLVLGIHLCACWIGAIIGRPHRPAPTTYRWATTLHRPVPNWMGRLSLWYALAVTLLSVAVQALGLGEQLANLSAAAQVGSTHMLLLVLPHAVPELVAVFLPLGLFLLEARRGRLDRLGMWSVQAAGLALPLLLGAALIETYVTPVLILAARH